MELLRDGVGLGVGHGEVCKKKKIKQDRDVIQRGGWGGWGGVAAKAGLKQAGRSEH